MTITSNTKAFFCINTLSWNHGSFNSGAGGSGYCPTCYGPAIKVTDDFWFLHKLSKNSSFTKPFMVILLTLFTFVLVSLVNRVWGLPFGLKVSNVLEAQSLAIFLTLTFICLRGLRINTFKILFQLIAAYLIFKALGTRVPWLPDVADPLLISVCLFLILGWQIVSRNKRRGLAIFLVMAIYFMISASAYPSLVFLSDAPTWANRLLYSIVISIAVNLLLLARKDHNLAITLKIFLYYSALGIAVTYLSLIFYKQFDLFSLAEFVTKFNPLHLVAQRFDYLFIGLAWLLPQFIDFFWGYNIKLWRLPEKYYSGLTPKSALRLLAYNRIKAFRRIVPGLKYYLEQSGNTRRSAIYLAIGGTILSEWRKPELARNLFDRSKQAIELGRPSMKPGRFYKREYAFLNYFSSAAEDQDLNLRAKTCLESVIIFSNLGDRIWLMRSITQLAWLYYQLDEIQKCSSLIKEFFWLGKLDNVGQNYYVRMESLRIMIEKRKQGFFELGWAAALGNEIDKEISMQDFQIMNKLAEYYRSEGADTAAHDQQYEVMSALAKSIFRISKSMGIQNVKQEFLMQTHGLIEETILLGMELKKSWDTFEIWQKAKSAEILEDLSISYAQNPLVIINFINDLDKEAPYRDIERMLKPKTWLEDTFQIFQQQLEDAKDDFRNTIYFARSLQIDVDENNPIDDSGNFNLKFMIFAFAKSIFRLPHYISSQRIKQPADYVDIMKSLSRKQVLVDYCVLSNRTFVMIFKKGFLSPKIHEIYVNTCDDREFIQNTFKTPQVIFSLNAETLNSWSKYIEPISRYISDGDSITFIPSDYLYYLPLHALPLNGKPLIECFPVSYLPAASIVKYMRLVEQRKASKDKLIMGDPKGDLPFALLEAQQISEIYHTNSIVGEQANSENWYRYAKTSGIIHLATHAKFGEKDSESTSFVLADKNVNIHEIYISNLNCDLVVLSACQSGLNTLSSGDEIFGFTSAFLFAGAKNVLVSLWPIDDLASSSLMVQFHALIDKGFSPKIALQQACIEMKNKNSHFFYWAPFVLIGN